MPAAVASGCLSPWPALTTWLSDEQRAVVKTVTRHLLAVGLVVTIGALIIAGAVWYHGLRDHGAPVRIVAFDAATGHELWRTDTMLAVARPVAISRDKLVIDGLLQGLSACTFAGRELTLDTHNGSELSRA